MHLKVQKRNGREYLSVVQNYRQDGKTKTRTVETIGYADSYADRFDDPVAHFRAYVDQLNERAALQQRPIELSFAYDDAIADAFAPPARLGAAIALGCLDAIGVRGFFRARAGPEGFPAHAGRIFEMLAAERMMHATSKRESWTARESFPRRCAFSYEDLYAALPCFSREAQRLDEHIARTWRKACGERDVGQAFLICGAYGFPVGGESERASIAVALDVEGVPLGYHERPGHLDSLSIREAVDAMRERIGANRFVVVAGGLRSVIPTMVDLARDGSGFVLLQHDLGETPGLAEWVADGRGYRNMGAGVQCKSRVSERILPDGSVQPVREVVLRGGGYALRQGRAVLISSETDLSTTAIVQLFRELWRQAEPFQPLEADFSSMPSPVASDDHIRAHFALCYAAFFALRVLRRKAGWRHNAADTADALLRMEGVHLQQNYYLFNYRNDVTDDIEDTLGIPPARRLRTQSELRSVPSAVRQALVG